MTIEEALRAIANTEPLGSEESGNVYCMYCHGEERRMVWTTGRMEFIHDDDCPWLYLKQQLEEDARIELMIEASYPGLMTHGKKESQ